MICWLGFPELEEGAVIDPVPHEPDLCLDQISKWSVVAREIAGEFAGEVFQKTGEGLGVDDEVIRLLGMREEVGGADFLEVDDAQGPRFDAGAEGFLKVGGEGFVAVCGTVKDAEEGIETVGPEGGIEGGKKLGKAEVEEGIPAVWFFFGKAGLAMEFGRFHPVVKKAEGQAGGLAFVSTERFDGGRLRKELVDAVKFGVKDGWGGRPGSFDFGLVSGEFGLDQGASEGEVCGGILQKLVMGGVVTPEAGEVGFFVPRQGALVVAGGTAKDHRDFALGADMEQGTGEAEASVKDELVDAIERDPVNHFIGATKEDAFVIQTDESPGSPQNEGAFHLGAGEGLGAVIATEGLAQPGEAIGRRRDESFFFAKREVEGAQKGAGLFEGVFSGFLARGEHQQVVTIAEVGQRAVFHLAVKVPQVKVGEEGGERASLEETAMTFDRVSVCEDKRVANRLG